MKPFVPNMGSHGMQCFGPAFLRNFWRMSTRDGSSMPTHAPTTTRSKSARGSDALGQKLQAYERGRPYEACHHGEADTGGFEDARQR